MRGRLSSLRARILMLVLFLALVPLIVVGWWMSGAAARGGEELLRARLRSAVDQHAAYVSHRWIPVRTELLNSAEDVLMAGRTDALDPASPGRWRIRAVRDAARAVVWPHPSTSPGGTGGDGAGLFAVELGAGPNGGGRVEIEAEVEIAALWPAPSSPPVPGLQLTAVGRGGEPLLPLAIDERLLERDRFEVAQEVWVRERRALAEPPLEIVAAAPLTPFVEPFEGAAQEALGVLVLVAALSLALAVWLTRRITRSLARLSAAAGAVATGDFSRQLEVSGSDEVAALASAFNTMSENLRRTLAELSHREALSAVGEFASVLAHEVRNPLTAIRVNLQILGERLPEDSPLRSTQEAALQQIERAERTVAGTLQLARSGLAHTEPLSLDAVVEQATDAARLIADRSGVSVRTTRSDTPARVAGDAGALQQMLLNLIVNAVAASERGEAVDVRCTVVEGRVLLQVEDRGRGMAPHVLARAREPFFSARHGGTGLGLAIVERIARAHRGRLSIESAETVGTTVTVELPLFRRV